LEKILKIYNSIVRDRGSPPLDIDDLLIDHILFQDGGGAQ
jgi:hypothetical protein